MTTFGGIGLSFVFARIEEVGFADGDPWCPVI
jgi:hypothetical protein